MEYTLEQMRKDFPPWVGFDLDGTLAYYENWEGPENIGSPIPAMVDLLYKAIKIGKKQGFEVVIFTSRACIPEHITYIKGWLVQHGLPLLRITCVKDHGCRRIYDDRAIRVRTNKGEIYDDSNITFE